MQLLETDVESTLKESLASAEGCSWSGTLRALEMLLPAAVSEEELWGGVGQQEKAGEIKRSPASPRSCSSVVSSLSLASHLAPGIHI